MHISAMDNQVENCEEIDKEDIHFLEVKENSRADLSCRGTFNTQIRSAEKKNYIEGEFSKLGLKSDENCSRRSRFFVILSS